MPGIRTIFLAMVFFPYSSFSLLVFPIVLGSSAWHAGYSLTYLLALCALAVYGFYISLASRRVFSDQLLDAEGGGKS